VFAGIAGYRPMIDRLRNLGHRQRINEFCQGAGIEIGQRVRLWRSGALR
jgi:aromatic ring hydroxylase